MTKRFARNGWSGFRRAIFLSPARLSVIGFLLLIGLGTALLTLPAAADGPRLGVVDALFTATSASCVNPHRRRQRRRYNRELSASQINRTPNPLPPTGQ